MTGYINAPPSSMVAEAEVVALHRAVATCLPVQQGEAIMTRAGHETAQYLLANRIPQVAQMVMKAPAAVIVGPRAAQGDCPACVDVRRQQHVAA